MKTIRDVCDSLMPLDAVHLGTVWQNSTEFDAGVEDQIIDATTEVVAVKTDHYTEDGRFIQWSRDYYRLPGMKQLLAKYYKEPDLEIEMPFPPVETPVLCMWNGQHRILERRTETPSWEESREPFDYWEDPENDGHDIGDPEVTAWMFLPVVKQVTL